MSNNQSELLRNVSITGGSSSGKTSIAEALIFQSKKVNRLGKIEEGNTVMDFQPEEIKRKQSINCAFTQITHKKTQINLLDTPGDMNFFSSTKTCIPFFDSSIVTIEAVGGPNSITEEILKVTAKNSIPSIIFINKLDRERADFYSTIEKTKSLTKNKIVVVQLPIGKEAEFKGFVDILSDEAFVYDDDGKATKIDIPEDIKQEVDSAKEEFIESVAELDDAILERYLEGETISQDELKTTFKQGLLKAKFSPVLCGSATKLIGSDYLADFIINYTPNPIERGNWKAFYENDNELELKPDEKEPFVGIVFNTIIDPFSGRLSIFRVISGSLGKDGTILNVNKDKQEKFTQLLEMDGKKQNNIENSYPGSIVAISKLKDTETGDTLTVDKKVIVKAPSPLKPVISFAITPKSKGDEDKIFSSLKKLIEEDTSIMLKRDSETKETILSGRGMVHIETTIEKLKRKFSVEVDISPPKIPYKETIKKKARVQGRHKKQTGGHGQFGDCWIEFSPLKRGEGFKFVDKIVGGAIPKTYIPAVEKGVIEASERGFLAGYPCVDFQAVLDDGSYHPVDSSELSFKIAGTLAFKNALAQSEVVLLEPIMKVKIYSPDSFTGDIMGDLNSRRGRVLGMEAGEDKTQIIQANVPMAEMLRYIPDLRSMTGGRGTFEMEFDFYDEVPLEIAQTIIEKNKTEN